MSTLMQDIRYGFRMMWKSPGFMLVAIFTIALGVGANSAIFSVINTVLLRPLPFENPERLLKVLSKDEKDGSVSGDHSYLNFLDLRDQNQVFEEVAAYSRSRIFLLGADEPEQLQGLVTSADLFPLLGVKPMVGRAFTREEEQPGGTRRMVISYGLWQRRFNSDPAVVGTEVMLTSGPATILGVMPRGFTFPIEGERMDYWMTLASGVPKQFMESRGTSYLSIIARLKQGVTHAQAGAEADTIARRLAAQYPDSNNGRTLALTSLHESMVGGVRPALLVLLGAVGFVLLIACANVANLLLSRASVRQKEIAIRTALGASRVRVVRQLLTESMLLSMIGGALGLLLGLWGVDLLVAASPADIPRLGEMGLDARVLGFTVAVTLLTGVIFGLAPALQSSKLDLNESLKEGGRGSTEGLRRNRVRSLLVISEVALSLVLLISAGLLIQSFVRLLNVSPGFEPRGLLSADLALSRTKYPEKEQKVRVFQQTFERIGQLPGVLAVGAVDPLPLGGNAESYSFTTEGRPAAAPGDEPTANYRVINPDYFNAMGIPLRRGRVFTDQDTSDTPPVVVVNETFARLYFAGEDPIGRRITVHDIHDAPPREIVGIVGDVRHEGLDVEAGPEFYFSYRQFPTARMTVVARTSYADAASLAPAVRGAIRQVDKDQPIFNVRTMDELLAASVARRRFNMLLLGAFASVALLLASIGIYGVVNYSVTQRTHEIGIRMALGAQASDVLKMIVGQGMILTLIGVVAGLGVAFILTRVMAGLLYGVSATDPLTFAGVSVLLSIVALLASYIPARRATRVDPMVALRYE